ncbi:MAG: hypothetical protein ABMB14_19060 [Myxococcota bacterium]
MNPALQESLTGLSGVTGCIGSCLLDRNGTVVAHRLPPPYEPVLVSGALAQIGIAIEMYSSLETSPVAKVFVARFDDGVLIVRWFDEYVAVALGTRTMNTAILMVALNALAMKLAARPLRTDAPTLSNAPGLSMPGLSVAPAMSGIVTAPGASPRPPPPALSDPGSSASIVPSGSIRFVPVDTVRDLVAALAQSLGPMAASVVKREAQKLGHEARTVPVPRFAELIDACALQISDPAGRRTFTAAARKLVP